MLQFAFMCHKRSNRWIASVAELVISAVLSDDRCQIHTSIIDCCAVCDPDQGQTFCPTSSSVLLILPDCQTDVAPLRFFYLDSSSGGHSFILIFGYNIRIALNHTAHTPSVWIFVNLPTSASRVITAVLYCAAKSLLVVTYCGIQCMMTWWLNNHQQNISVQKIIFKVGRSAWSTHSSMTWWWWWWWWWWYNRK